MLTQTKRYAGAKGKVLSKGSSFSKVSLQAGAIPTEDGLMDEAGRVDWANECVGHGDAMVHLPPKTFAVLRLLIEQAGQLVTKEALLEAIWPDTVVSEAVLTVCVGELRKALRDSAQAPRFIQTVHRRGGRVLGHPPAPPPPFPTPARGGGYRFPAPPPPPPAPPPRFPPPPPPTPPSPPPLRGGREGVPPRRPGGRAPAGGGPGQFVGPPGGRGRGKTA